MVSYRAIIAIFILCTAGVSTIDAEEPNCEWAVNRIPDLTRWWPTYCDDRYAVHLDIKTLDKTEGGFRFWVKWLYLEPKSSTSQYPYESFDSTLALVEIKCPSLSYRTGDLTYYSGREVVGAAKKSAPYGEWDRPLPDTIGEAVYAEACKTLPSFWTELKPVSKRK